MSKTADNDCSLPESACMAVEAVREKDGNMAALNRQGPLMLLPAAAGVDCKRWSWPCNRRQLKTHWHANDDLHLLWHAQLLVYCWCP
jgi:hypothetical protein